MKANSNSTEIQIFIQPHMLLEQADEDLAQALAAKGLADIYTLRQRLQGEFPARLAHGEAAQMEKLAQVLEEQQRPYRRISLQEPTFTPEALEKISLADSHVRLYGSSTTLHCAPGVHLLIILADISGKIEKRHLQRKMVRHTYGVNTPNPLDTAALEQEIFRLSPILDVYTLTPSGSIDAGVRIIPGKFDHHQLGGAATLSRNKNLAVLWQKIQASGADLKIYPGFGLGFIPECKPETVAHADPYTQRENLRALTQYAWLMAALEKGPDPETTSGGNTLANSRSKPRYSYAFAPLTSPPQVWDHGKSALYCSGCRGGKTHAGK